MKDLKKIMRFRQRDAQSLHVCCKDLEYRIIPVAKDPIAKNMRACPELSSQISPGLWLGDKLTCTKYTLHIGTKPCISAFSCNTVIP